MTIDGLVDIVAEGFDAGIRRDRRLAPGMIAVPLGPARRFAVVGAPSYFARCEPPRTPADLHIHTCIGRLFPDGSRYAWEFAREGEAFQVEVSGTLAVDDTRLMLRAALDGVGLAFVYECLVADHLAAGRLIQVLDEWCSVEPRFFLYYAGADRSLFRCGHLSISSRPSSRAVKTGFRRCPSQAHRHSAA